jgi:hypothetical protein
LLNSLITFRQAISKQCNSNDLWTMANRTFYFFYAPTWDYPPEGPIKLGNVITSIKTPERPLYTAPLPTDPEVFSSEKSHVEFSTEKLKEGKFSILTKFLSILGVGVDVGANWDNRYDGLKSRTFYPSSGTLVPLFVDLEFPCIVASDTRRLNP